MARPQHVIPNLVAGTSVALVLIPQSLAYAELAGMPAYAGLYASALAPVLAAFFASSPYLQTGPTAVTSLLTFGALGPLAAQSGPEYIALAGLLALLVGGFRTVFGLLRAGPLAFFLSPPVLLGFTVGAAILIFASQIPTVLGLPKGAGVLASAGRALAAPDLWHLESLVVAAITFAVVLVGKRVHKLFPGVLVAAVAGLLYATFGGYSGADLGAVPEGFVSLHLDLPWDQVGDLLVPGLVIAIVGFAEPTAIARAFAVADRTTWDANREFISQGVANLASGAVGGFPVGGSFSRSALSRFAGAKTPLAGAFTGAVVLAFLPFAGVLSPLPKPVLGAIIIASILSLLKLRELVDLVRRSYPQAAIALTTMALTLALAPRVERAILVGIGLSIAVHAWREMRVGLQADFCADAERLRVRPHGVLWFPSAEALQQRILDELAKHPACKSVVVDLGGLGRIDYSGALALESLSGHVGDAGVDLSFVEVPPQAHRILTAVCPELVGPGSHQGPAPP